MYLVADAIAIAHPYEDPTNVHIVLEDTRTHARTHPSRPVPSRPLGAPAHPHTHVVDSMQVNALLKRATPAPAKKAAPAKKTAVPAKKAAAAPAAKKGAAASPSLPSLPNPFADAAPVKKATPVKKAAPKKKAPVAKKAAPVKKAVRKASKSAVSSKDALAKWYGTSTEMDGREWARMRAHRISG